MAKIGRRPDCFLQVNIGAEDQKGGCAIADVPALLDQARAAGLPAIDLAESARERSEVAPARIVPLWTLVTLATAATIGSFVMLTRERRGHSTSVARRDASGRG